MTSETLSVGANVTWAELQAYTKDSLPDIYALTERFGSPQVRNVATVVGNIAYGSPVADSSCLLLVMGAELELASARGVRRALIADFHTGPNETTISPDEIITHLRIPLPARDEIVKLYKISKRKEMDVSTFRAAIRVALREKAIASAAIAYSGIAPTARRLGRTESFLIGKPFLERTFRDAGRVARDEIEPISDVRGSRNFRWRLAENVLLKFYHDAVADGPASGLGGKKPGFTVTGSNSTAAPTSWIGTPVPHESAPGHVTGRAVFLTTCRTSAMSCLSISSAARTRHARLPSVDVGRAAEDRWDGPGASLPPTSRAITGLARCCTTKSCWRARMRSHRTAGCRSGREPIVRRCAPRNRRSVISARAIAGRAVDRRGDRRRTFHWRAEAAGGVTPRRRWHIVRTYSLVASAPAARSTFTSRPRLRVAVPGEDGELTVISSNAEPIGGSGARRTLSWPSRKPGRLHLRRAWGVGSAARSRRLPSPRCMAALVAFKTGRPAHIVYPRELDMRVTGKRHPYLSRYKVGFTSDGRIEALELALYSDGGCSTDLSLAVMDRSLFHADNAYFVPNIAVTGTVCRTNLPSNTAMRGFGAPQAIAAIEHVIEEIAAHLDLDPLDVRQQNCYGGAGRDTTHYGQVVANNSLPAILDRLAAAGDYAGRRAGPLD